MVLLNIILMKLKLMMNKMMNKKTIMIQSLFIQLGLHYNFFLRKQYLKYCFFKIPQTNNNLLIIIMNILQDILLFISYLSLSIFNPSPNKN